MAIKTFKDKATAAAFLGLPVRSVPPLIRKRARAKLEQVHLARTLDDLRVPPGNGLEALSGDRLGQHSIRINQQWRVCFVWRDGSALDVEIVDYHRRSLNMSIRIEDLPHLDFSDVVEPRARRIPPTSPGEMLVEEFLKPLLMSNYRLAKEIGVPAQRIGEIIAGRRSITADTDLRLCRFFGLSDGWWLRLQADYDTEIARHSLSKVLAKIKPWVTAAEQGAAS